MSSEGNSAEKKFWRSPELIEALLPFIDPPSTRCLAQVHPLSLDILQSAFVWNKLITRSIPDKKNTDITEESLYELVPKVTSLARILHMMEDKKSPQLELSLIHTVCTRFPAYHINAHRALWTPLGNRLQCVTLSCSCHKSHSVSPLGFVLLEMVEHILGTVLQTAKEVHVRKLGYEDKSTLMESLSSRVSRQQKMVTIEYCAFANCGSRELAEGFFNLMKQSKKANVKTIVIKREIGKHGWTDVRSAIQLLHERNPECAFNVNTTREVMVEGEREDLRAIWESLVGVDYIGGALEVESSWKWKYPFGVGLFKHEGEEHWERLERILDMTAEEWDAELMEENQEEEDEEEVEEEDEAEEEEEGAGPSEG